jgi:hypothetical protein
MVFRRQARNDLACKRPNANLTPSTAKATIIVRPKLNLVVPSSLWSGAIMFFLFSSNKQAV